MLFPICSVVVHDIWRFMFFAKGKVLSYLFSFNINDRCTHNVF